MEQIERRLWIGENAVNAHQKAGADNAGHQPGHGGPTALGHRQDAQHDERPDQVELLLHPQRPGVEQPLRLGGDVEIAGGKKEEHIAERKCRVEAALRELLVVAGEQQEISEPGGHHDHDQQGWKDASYSTTVELSERQGRAPVELLRNEAGHQKTGNHEKNVHPDEPAREPDAQVKNNDREDRDAPQPLNVGPEYQELQPPFGAATLSASPTPGKKTSRPRTPNCRKSNRPPPHAPGRLGFFSPAVEIGRARSSPPRQGNGPAVLAQRRS